MLLLAAAEEEEEESVMVLPLLVVVSLRPSVAGYHRWGGTEGALRIGVGPGAGRRTGLRTATFWRFVARVVVAAPQAGRETDGSNLGMAGSDRQTTVWQVGSVYVVLFCLEGVELAGSF